MRPDDLVFNYWVNNYLMGEKPPAFDILAWNADGTNLPAALHNQFLDIFAFNTLCQPGRPRSSSYSASCSASARPALSPRSRGPWRIGCAPTSGHSPAV